MNQDLNYILNLDKAEPEIVLDYISHNPWLITRFMDRFSIQEMQSVAKNAIETQPRYCAFLFKLGLLTKEEAREAALRDLDILPVFLDIYHMEGILDK